MPSPLMCVNNRGGSPTPRLLLNGTVLVPFGTPPVVTSEPTFAGLAAADQERIAQVGDRIFWVQYDSVLEYDKALDTWSVVHVLVTPIQYTAAGPQQFTGAGGLQYWEDPGSADFGLIMAYRTNAIGYLYVLKYVYATDTWTDIGLGPNAFSGGALSGCMFRNQLVLQDNSQLQVRFVDPVTLVVTNTTPSVPAGYAAGSQNTKFWVAKNKLYLSQTNATAGILMVFGGGFWSTVATLPGSNTVLATWSDNGSHLSFPAGNVAMIAYLETVGDKWRLAEVNLDTYVVTDRTSDLPAPMRVSNATGTLEEQWRPSVIVDQEDPLGTVRYLILMCYGFQGQTSILYEFVAPGTPWTDLGSSDFHAYMPSMFTRLRGGSTGVFRANETWGRIVPPQLGVAGGVVASLQFYGNGDEAAESLGAGAGVAFNLATTPVGKVPIEPGTVVIDYTDTGVLARQITDDGVGGLVGDVSGGATIDYDTGAMTGTTLFAVQAGPNKVILSAYRTLKTVRLRHSVTEQAALVQTTLADPGLNGPVGGQAVIAANELTKVKVDNGVTTYKVRLALLAQFVPDGSRLTQFVEIVSP